MIIVINLNNRTIKIESAELALTKMDARDDANDRTGLTDAMAAIIAGLEACESSDEAQVGEQGQTTESIALTKENVVAALRDLIDEKPQWGSRSQEAIGKQLQASGFDISELNARLREAVAAGMIDSRERRNGDVVFSLND
jgi:hypothetical protein